MEGYATISCSISDTGIGIAPDLIGKLFDDFTQADSSISRRFGGTGLGLAISKRIVEQMGGEIRVESPPGTGATFHFTLTLPIADVSDLGGGDSPADPVDPERVLACLEQPLRILLAEDNATNQMVFCKMMQPFNVDVTIAANGREAWVQASTRTFDIVFMDMRMPEMDGLEATREIRALAGPSANVPIVALTANAFADDVKACRDAGMNGFLSKPMRKKVLARKLVELLGDHPLLVQAAKSAARAPHSPTDMRLPMTPPAEVAMTDVVPTLDPDAFRTLIEEIDLDGVREMLGVFLEETADRLTLMRKLSCQDDRVRISNEAHTLKGAAGTIGLRQIAELAKTLELSAHTITPEDYSTLVDRLDVCFQRARDETATALERPAQSDVPA